MVAFASGFRITAPAQTHETHSPCPTARDDAGLCIRPCFLNRAKDVVYESFIIIENRYTDTREKLSQSKKWLR